MPTMSWKPGGAAVLLAVFFATPPARAAGQGFEVGVLAGTTRFEQALTGDDARFELTAGLRGGYALSPRLVWYGDVVHATTSTASFRGDADALVARTGLEYVFQPARDVRWFVDLGGGYTWIEFDQGDDYENWIYSAGVGQRIRLGPHMSWRWEVRADNSVSRGGYEKTLNDGKILVGLSWGSLRNKRHRSAP